ncbi:MAG: DUF1328 domain-containing protein [Hyphomicrobium sp.]
MGKLTHWAVVFAVFAVIYGALGFSGLAGVGAVVANGLFVCSMLLAIAATVASLLQTHR